MLNCPACGDNVTEQDTYCPNCGQELKKEEPPAPPVEPNSVSPPVEPSSEPIPPGETARITLKLSGELTDTTFLIRGRMVIGRFDPDSSPVDVDLNNLPPEAADYISRKHAGIWQDGSGQWLVKDLGSKNHTFFRAPGQSKWKRVTAPQAIDSGDEIAFGNVQFEFRVE